MALQFFRRRQKMVIFIMVILMVSFLVGGYGLSHVAQKDRGSQAWGTCKFGKVTLADLVSADYDLNLLMILSQAVRDLDFGAVIANRDNATLAYALLGKEAARSPIMVTADDVDAYLRARGWEGARLESLLTQLRVRMSGLNEKRLRQVVVRWLKVQTLYSRSSFFAACPARYGAAASEQQLRHLFRDLMERIDLRVAVLKADDYLKDVPEPNAAEVQQQFETYRAQSPGQGSKANPFGFGYVQPDRARIRYLLIRQDVVERVARPNEEEVRAQYIRNRERYVKPASARQGDAAASPAAGTPAPATSVPAGEPMTFSEAKPLIIQELTGAAVNRAMDDLVAQVTVLMDQYATEDRGTLGDAYTFALMRMTLPAEAVLSRELDDLDLRAQPLDTAVAALADKAGLAAIAFPWGHHGQRTLDADVKVTLKAPRMTLGKALDSICTQVKWPPLKWAMARTLPGTLFSVGDGQGVDFFPLEVRDTAPLGIREMVLDEVLGRSETSAEDPLVRIVFTAEPFQPGGKGGGIKLGDDGPRMVVTGLHPGRLLWRLVGAEPGHAPQRLDEVPGLAEQVTADIRIRAAYERALEEARRVEQRAREVGLASAAKRADVATFQTGLFARRTEVRLLQRYEALARLTGRGVSLADLALQEPVRYSLMDVEGLELPSADQKEIFMDAAFALAPANVEPPYPSSPRATGLASLPFLREVLVMERIGYEPPVLGDYAQIKRILAMQLEAVGLWRSRIAWFAMSSIARRLHYAQRERS